MTPSVRNEVRSRLPILAFFIPLMAMAVMLPHLGFSVSIRTSDVLLSAALFATATLIGILGFGSDIASETMGLLLSMPRRRASIWLEKLVVSAGCLAVVIAAFVFTAHTAARAGQPAMLIPIVMAIYGFGVGFLLPLVIPHLAGSILLGMTAAAIPHLIDQYTAPWAKAFGVHGATSCLATSALALGGLAIGGSYIAFRRFPWAGRADAALCVPSFTWRRHPAGALAAPRTRGALGLLIRREVRIQIAPGLLFLAVSAVLLGVMSLGSEGYSSVRPFDIALRLFPGLIALTVLITAAMTFAEPRRQGILLVERSQPVSWRLLLAVKLGVLALATVFCILAIVAIAIWQFSLVQESPVRLALPMTSAVTVIFFVVATFGLFASCHGANLLDALIKAGTVAAALVAPYIAIDFLFFAPGITVLHALLMMPAFLALTLWSCARSMRRPAGTLHSAIRLPVVPFLLAAVLWVPTLAIHYQVWLPFSGKLASSSRPGPGAHGKALTAAGFGRDQTLVVDARGRLWEWGFGLDALSGQSITNWSGHVRPVVRYRRSNRQKQRFPDRRWRRVALLGSFAWAGLASDGHIYMWGWNPPKDEMGHKFRFAETEEQIIREPRECGMGEEWTELLRFDHYGLLALQRNGGLWGFGGRNGLPSNESGWQEIQSGFRWRQVVSAGRHGIAALRDDGTLWFGGETDSYLRPQDPNERQDNLPYDSPFRLGLAPAHHAVARIEYADLKWAEWVNDDGTTGLLVRSIDPDPNLEGIPDARIIAKEDRLTSECGWFRTPLIKIVRDEPLGLRSVVPSWNSTRYYVHLGSGEIWEVETNSDQDALLEFLADRARKHLVPGSPNWASLSLLTRGPNRYVGSSWMYAIGKDGSWWRWGGYPEGHREYWTARGVASSFHQFRLAGFRSLVAPSRRPVMVFGPPE